MAVREYLALRPTFANGRWVPRGHPVLIDEAKVKPGQKNLAPASGLARDVVQIAAVGPTGPNPKNPQQVPPGTFQTVEGHVIQGARLVGETTGVAQIEEAEADKEKAGRGQEKVQDILAGRSPSAEAAALLDDGEESPVDANAPEVIAGIDENTDLDALEAAENGRDKPRKSVLAAIDAERDRRGD